MEILALILHPTYYKIPSASGTNYAAKIEGGSGIYVEEDVEVGGQIATSDIAPLSEQTWLQ